MSSRTLPFSGVRLRGAFVMSSVFLLAACADGQMPGFLQPKAGGDEVVARASTAGGGRVSERDVEAPDVFQAKEAGLWDGRPSLGGVWVAHPDVTDPERVIIRNQQNGKFVIGALFKRERQSPGPRLQVSSDAAAALGVLAGQPTNLDVVALRREETADPAATSGADLVAAVPDTLDVEAAPLDPVIAGANKALETASLALKPSATPLPTAKPAAATAPKPKTANLSKPFVQIGIFSVQQNAKNTATAMRQAGMVPTIKTHSSKGKTFWRVVVGPAQTKDELATLLKTIKGSGFTDAYAVTN